MKDGSLAAAVLESGTPSIPVPSSLIEACTLPEIGSRLAYLSVRMDEGLRRPFRLDGSIIAVRPDVAADLGSAALVLREAIELASLGGGRIGWADRIVAHATAGVPPAGPHRQPPADALLIEGRRPAHPKVFGNLTSY